MRAVCIVGAVALASSGCAGFLEDRWKDAADILTATVEAKTAGFKAQVGPWAGVGIYGSAADAGARGIGVVGGQVTSYDFTDVTYPPILGAVQQFRHFEDDRRHKEFNFVQSYFIPWLKPQVEPTGTFGGFEDAANWRRLAPRYTQIEMAVGLGFGFRLGVNAGELVDFLLGWTGLDIFDDDLRGDLRGDLPGDPKRMRQEVPADGATTWRFQESTQTSRTWTAAVASG